MKLRITETTRTRTFEIELPVAKRRVDRDENGPGIASCTAPKWYFETEGEAVGERKVDSK